MNKDIINKIRKVITKPITVNLLIVTGIGLTSGIMGYCMYDMKVKRHNKLAQLNRKYNDLLDRKNLDKTIAIYKDQLKSGQLSAHDYNEYMTGIQTQLDALKASYLKEKKKIIF